MFIRNLTNNEIKDISFDGYLFTIPAKCVCAVTDEFGEWIVKHFSKGMGVEDAITKKPTGGLPPVLPAVEEEWDGKNFATVTRFKVDGTRMPKNDLVRLARKRGMEDKQLKNFEDDDRGEYENEDIANAINDMPVPEEIRFPEEYKPKNKKNESKN